MVSEKQRKEIKSRKEEGEERKNIEREKKRKLRENDENETGKNISGDGKKRIYNRRKE